MTSLVRGSLTERRRTALQLEIARAAVRLFTEQGVSRTTGEQIARTVGISARTLWRHFPSKESCVRPLLAEGLDNAVRALGDWPYDVRLLDHLRGLFEYGGLPPADPAVLDLIRMTHHEPALRDVWLRAHDDALPVLVELLAARSGRSSGDLAVHVHAATLNGALRAAAEDFARHAAGTARATADDLSARLRTALAAATQGLPY